LIDCLFQESSDTNLVESKTSSGDVNTADIRKGSDDDAAETKDENNMSSASATDAVKTSRSAEKKRARKLKVSFL